MSQETPASVSKTGVLLFEATIVWSERFGALHRAKILRRKFPDRTDSKCKRNAAIFHLQEVTLSVNGVDCDIEDLVKSFVISALALISHG
jgi:hypothetical protein